MAARPDVELLEDLLAIEQRLISAYEGALRREAIDVGLGEMLRDHEREHADAIERALAGSGQRNPRAIVPEPELTAALRGRTSFARFALDLENEAVAAYAR
ncbi:MAG TPA: ferritin-like domain-containing protein, partial [Thermoleophilaceae bacterium]|nr:ferritin-like domain-containing protein [Thermoleophilaceae bacterium]